MTRCHIYHIRIYAIKLIALRVAVPCTFTHLDTWLNNIQYIPCSKIIHHSRPVYPCSCSAIPHQHIHFWLQNKHRQSGPLRHSFLIMEIPRISSLTYLHKLFAFVASILQYYNNVNRTHKQTKQDLNNAK